MDLGNRCILNAKEDPIASFQASNLAKYYHLEKGTRSLDDELLNKFLHKAKELFKIWYKPNRTFKLIPSSKYLTIVLRAPYQYIVVMLCRLCGEQDASKFTLSLIPLIYYCANEGSMFNWVDILSIILVESITVVKETKPEKFPSFHMVSYLLDIMCIPHQYPKMGWAWKPVDSSIHIYYKVLWEHNYIIEYHKIYNHFLAPMYEFIFCAPTLCMTDKVLEIIQNIGDCYLMENETYIRIYGATKAPHLLLRFVPNKLVVQEITYQIVIYGVGAALYRENKAMWHLLLLWVGSYSFENIKRAQAKVDMLLS
jgi:hypothetical protein